MKVSDMSIYAYLTKYDHLVINLRNYSTESPELVLAYINLKSADLSQENERLVRATHNECVKFSTCHEKIIFNVT